jgi:AcrR family transcriptional regulator
VYENQTPAGSAGNVLSMNASAPPARGRGRPAAATREQLLELSTGRFLRGRRIDVQALAGELGLSRATIYRWFGSREELIGEVAVRAAEPLLREARENARGEGARALLETFDAFNRALAQSGALRRFIEQEQGTALRVLTSSAGRVQPRICELIAQLITREIEAGTYAAPTDAATLAYAIVRLAEAFLYNDALASVRGDIECLREVEAAILGLQPR